MIILPLGHDKEFFRFPYATPGIGMQICGATRSPSEEQQLRLRRDETLLLAKIRAEHGRQA